MWSESVRRKMMERGVKKMIGRGKRSEKKLMEYYVLNFHFYMCDTMICKKN
jgi:hypothetical protein